MRRSISGRTDQAFSADIANLFSHDFFFFFIGFPLNVKLLMLPFGEK